MTHYPRFDGSQACLDAPPEASQAFLAAAGADPGPALALNRRCAFTDPCRAYALTSDVYGVWGATTDEDRDLHRVREDQPAPTSITDDLDHLVLDSRPPRHNPDLRRAS